jgi:hypothetical protein
LPQAHPGAAFSWNGYHVAVAHQDIVEKRLHINKRITIRTS